jgi:hypothetical protein
MKRNPTFMKIMFWLRAETVHGPTHLPDDGGSKYLCGFSNLLPDKAQQPERQPPAYSPRREPKISLSLYTTTPAIIK